MDAEAEEEDDYLSDLDDLLGESDDEEVVRKPDSPPKTQQAVKSRGRVSSKQLRDCPQCHLTMKSESEYNTHIKQLHAKECAFCPLRFTYDHGLEDHVAKEHELESSMSTQTAFRCTICHNTFSRQKAFETHQRRTHDLKCTEKRCKLQFTSISNRDTHVAEAHTNIKKTTTSEPRFQSPSNKTVSVRTDFANAFIQDSPKKKTKYVIPKKAEFQKTKLNPSESTVFKKKSGKSNKSNLSGKKSTKNSKKSEIKSSLVTPETQPPPETGPENDTVCEQCGVRFPDFEEFAAHIGILHEFPCSESGCERSYVHDYYLKVHLHLVHGFEPPDPLEEPQQQSFTKQFTKTEDEMDEDLDADDSVISVENMSGLAEDISLVESALNNVHTCFQCDQNFTSAEELNSHIASHYKGGRNKSLQSSSDVATDGDRRASVESTGQLSNPSQIMQRCHICSKICVKSAIVYHLRTAHSTLGKSKPLLSEACKQCGARNFNTPVDKLKHQEMKHNAHCDQCPFSFLSQADLVVHKADHHPEGGGSYPCEDCGEVCDDRSSFQQHHAQPHPFPCTQQGCQNRFILHKDLDEHLKAKHRLSYIKVQGSESLVRMTTERSILNANIAKSPESWISTHKARERLRLIMSGMVRSERHELFLKKKEREQCNGSKTSTLYQLSNPGFLGGDQDTDVIKHIIDTVFKPTFGDADPRLKKLGPRMDQDYCALVLFPETFIHKFETMNLSRPEAEQQFLEVHVDNQEWEGLQKDIEEAGAESQRLRDEESQSEEEWVDHSDISDTDD